MCSVLNEDRGSYSLIDEGIVCCRSTLDDYTPPTQVDKIQFLVICLLEELCAHTDLRYHYHYLGTPEHKRKQSPHPLEGTTAAPTDSDGGDGDGDSSL